MFLAQLQLQKQYFIQPDVTSAIRGFKGTDINVLYAQISTLVARVLASRKNNIQVTHLSSSRRQMTTFNVILVIFRSMGPLVTPVIIQLLVPGSSACILAVLILTYAKDARLIQSLYIPTGILC
jgi:hypothetical protein